MAQAQVTIEGKGFGSMELEPFFVRGSILFPPEGACFFCPHCGRIWAEIRLPAGFRHNVYTTPCKDHHESFFSPGGSVWLPLHPEVINSYPHAVILYEFLLHLDLLETGNFDIEPPLPVHPEPRDGHQEDLREVPQDPLTLT